MRVFGLREDSDGVQIVIVDVQTKRLRAWQAPSVVKLERWQASEVR